MRYIMKGSIVAIVDLEASSEASAISMFNKELICLADQHRNCYIREAHVGEIEILEAKEGAIDLFPNQEG